MSRRMTAAEFFALLIVTSAVGIVFWVQKNNADIRMHDNARKQDVNALHVYLEEVFAPARGAYPEVIDPKVLAGLDEAVTKDPNGRTINAPEADYEYNPTDCRDGLCAGYSLTAKLQKEANFTRTNRTP